MRSFSFVLFFYANCEQLDLSMTCRNSFNLLLFVIFLFVLKILNNVFIMETDFIIF